MNCKEVYKENGMVGEWLNDELEHDFSILEMDNLGIKIRICKHCRGRNHPK